MIEIFKDRTKKTFIVAKDVHPATLRLIATKRFNGRSFVIRKGYVKGNELYLEKPDVFDYVARVAFTTKEA